MQSAPNPHDRNDRKTRATVFERHTKLIRVLLVLLPILALDCGASLVLGPGTVNDFRSRHPYFHHGLLSNREAIAAWGDGEPYPIFTNSLGLLDRAARQVPLESSKHRILFIGDSYTEGLGVPFDETFVGLISERVDPNEVEILNAAVLSYSPKLYYLKTRYLIERQGLQFDELYVFIDISDIQDEILYSDFVPSERAPNRGLGERIHRHLTRHSFAYWAIERLRRHQQIQRRMQRYNAQVYPPWLNYFWHDDVNEEAYSDPDFVQIRAFWTLSDQLIRSKWTQRGIQSAWKHMDKLVRLCRERGIRVTIGVYPWTVQIAEHDIDSLQVRLWRDFAEKHDVGFIDLFPNLIGELPIAEFEARYVLPGDAHWNAEGHRLVADGVWPHIANGLRAANDPAPTALRPR
ncbi:MAG: hypothetical protein JRG94_03160 [Deltaproteobacteria bacterium]|nr:hypothetical protein [Deltaproteobacteria bacterium]